MIISNFFKKYKIKAKKFYTILIITIVEIFLMLWLNSWQPSPALIAPFIQFIMIFENRNIWNKLSKKEKEDLTLSKEDVENFVVGVEHKLSKGKTVAEIVEKIMSD